MKKEGLPRQYLKYKRNGANYRSGNLWWATRLVGSTGLVVLFRLINTTSLVDSTSLIDQARPIIGLGLSVASSQKNGQVGGSIASRPPGGGGCGGVIVGWK